MPSTDMIHLPLSQFNKFKELFKKVVQENEELQKQIKEKENKKPNIKNAATVLNDKLIKFKNEHNSTMLQLYDSI